MTVDYSKRTSPFNLNNKTKTLVVPVGDGTAFLIVPRAAAETVSAQAKLGQPIEGRNGYEDHLRVELSDLRRVHENGVPSFDDPSVILTSQRKQHDDASFADQCETAGIVLGKRTKISKLTQAELVKFGASSMSSMSRWTYHISWEEGGNIITRDLTRIIQGCGGRENLIFENFCRDNLTGDNLKVGEPSEMNTQGRYAVRKSAKTLTLVHRDVSSGERDRIRVELADEIRDQVRTELLAEFGELFNK
jgi:hypothetical protein